MVSNLFLNNALRVFENFKGCYSCDDIPFISSKTQNLFIINLDKRTDPGSHFVFLETFHKRSYYWDPFGHNLTNIHILEYLQKNGFYTVDCIRNRVQHYRSISCGLFVLSLGIIDTNKYIETNFVCFSCCQIVWNPF